MGKGSRRLTSAAHAAALLEMAPIVAFLIFFWAVHRFSVGLGAMISYVVPIAGLILAFVVLGERPRPLQIVGALVIVLDVRLAARSPIIAPGSLLPSH
jgi:O-acetylserine/cysteine efflux transporter